MKPDISNSMDLPPQPENHRRRRYVVLGLGFVILVAVIIFGPMLRKQEPNYYDPARAALINARQQFEESLAHEEVLLEQIRMAHEELDSAITQLARVADLDPSHRSAIESLRASLLSIENPDHPEETSPEQLRQSYRDLLVRMDALIKDVEKRSRQQ